MYDSIHQALKSCCPQFTSTRAFSFNCKFVIGGVLMHESSMHVWGPSVSVCAHVSSL